MNQPIDRPLDEAADPAHDRFVDRMGQLLESDGFTRTAGRIFGLLLLTPGALSLEDLAVALQASRGAVSQETRALEKLGALERVSRPGDRRVYYEVSDRMHERMLELRVQRFEFTREALRDGLKAEAARHPRVRRRMEGLDSFFAVMLESIRQTREEWHVQRGEGAE
ncbi:MAG TPA: MarR family transcriptional regulator [Longimicrobiales bacterium]|nr:MarR family transcriptional regulator [Longimicrobiales bacterium]